MQGWLPKPGLQYGAHYVLYGAHPEVCHSEFMVRWLPCTKNTAPNAVPEMDIRRRQDESGDETTVAGSMNADAAGVACNRNETPYGNVKYALAQQNSASFVVDTAAASGTHASAAVMADAHQEDQDVDWTDVMATLRVAGNVRKRLLLLNLHIPDGTSLEGPDCLTTIEVRHKCIHLRGDITKDLVSNASCSQASHVSRHGSFARQMHCLLAIGSAVVFAVVEGVCRHRQWNSSAFCQGQQCQVDSAAR